MKPWNSSSHTAAMYIQEYEEWLFDLETKSNLEWEIRQGKVRMET